MFSKKNFKFQFNWHFKQALHDGALTSIGGWHSEFAHRQGFLEVTLSPRSDFHDRIMAVFNAVLPDGLKITGSDVPYWFSALSLVQRDFSVSPYLLMLLCTAEDETFNVFAILCQGTLSWSWHTISRHSVLQFLFPAFRCPLFQSWVCVDMFLSSNSKWANIFHEVVKCRILNFWYVFYILL